MENIKVQIWPDSNNQGLNPGWIKNTAVTNKNNEEGNNPIPIIGPSNIPIPGTLSFDPNELNENKFKGCIGIENGVGKYITFNTTVPKNGDIGKNLNFNLNFNNLSESDKLNNIGSFINNNKTVNINTYSESLNSLQTNNDTADYPYFIYDSNNINNLSYKKIYFIPNDTYQQYKVIVKNGTKLNTSTKQVLFDYNNNNEFTNVLGNTFNFQDFSDIRFRFYNDELSGNNIDKNLMYFENEGYINLFSKKVFTNNSLNSHTISKKISFLLTDLVFKENTSKIAYYIEDNKNLVIKYENLVSIVNLVNINVEIKLALNSNSLNETYNFDDDINLKPGTILISYGDISTKLKPLVGLSNSNNITLNENLKNYDNLLDTQWLDENGFGVPKLRANIGFGYNNSGDRTTIFTLIIILQ